MNFYKYLNSLNTDVRELITRLHKLSERYICIAVNRLSGLLHGKKGFVIPTKSFVKIGITKHFVKKNV